MCWFTTQIIIAIPLYHDIQYLGKRYNIREENKRVCNSNEVMCVCVRERVSARVCLCQGVVHLKTNNDMKIKREIHHLM